MSKFLSISEAASDIRSGRTTPRELVEGCLTRIERYDEQIRAWVVVDGDAALRASEQLGYEAAQRQFRGVLHGVPIGIKDIIDVAGLATQAGSPLLQGDVATADSPLVAALRRAGAIILGKTVTVEFACFDPSKTRNPWDPTFKHTPGGSSSGSAAAVAMGMCLGAIGTQTGGSLVRPSTYCGISTCKPTFGQLSVDGVLPVSYHLDHPGPMARSVIDLQIMMQALVDEEEFEPLQTTTPPKLGFVEQFFMEKADEEVRELTESAIDKFKDAGAEVVPVRFEGGFQNIREMHLTIMAAEAAAFHRDRFAEHRDEYGPMITGLLDDGLKLAAVDYAAALSRQRLYSREVERMIDAVDALVMPSTDTTAPLMQTTGKPKFQAPWSCAGLPVVAIPSGVASNGLPAGVQFVGRRNRDASVLRVARWCERQIAFDNTPPPAR